MTNASQYILRTSETNYYEKIGDNYWIRVLITILVFGEQNNLLIKIMYFILLVIVVNTRQIKMYNSSLKK